MTLGGKIANWIFYNSLFAIALLIPIHPRFTGPFIAIAFTVWLFQNQFRIGFTSKKIKTIFLATIGLYLSYTIGCLYSQNFKQALAEVELRSSMVIFPLLLFSVSNLKFPGRKKLQLIFIAGCFITACFILANATFVFLTEGINLFTSRKSTLFLSLNPAYTSLEFIFSITVLIQLLAEEKTNRIKITIIFIFILTFLSLIILMGARTQIIILFILACIGIIVLLKKKRFRYLAVFTFLIISGVAIINTIAPSVMNRIRDIKTELEAPYTNEQVNSINERIVIWKTSASLISKKPIFGYGTGDDNDVLLNEYKQLNLHWPFIDGLNAHNQWLQTALAIGLPGIISMILLFGISFSAALKTGNILLFTFIVSFFVSTLTESFFETEAGILFFSFLNSILLSKTINTETNSNTVDTPTQY